MIGSRLIGGGRLNGLAAAAALLASMGAPIVERGSVKIPGRFTSRAVREDWTRKVDQGIDTRRETLAGKPWKRGGRLTIRQRRGLAFAVRRIRGI